MLFLGRENRDMSICKWFISIIAIPVLCGCFVCKTSMAASISDPDFIIVTTDMPVGATISFSIKAKGNLQIDWGDGVVDTANGKGEYMHTYTTGGKYTIGLVGNLTDQGQTTISFNNNPYIEKLEGNLIALFSSNVSRLNFVGSFSNCPNLTTISDTLFSGFTGSVGKFDATFSECPNLQYIETERGLVTFIPDTMASLNFSNTTFSGTQILNECPPGTTPLNAMVATCQPNQYTITYIMNGGINYVNAPSTYFGGIQTIISGEPTYTDYVFVGWCDDMELTQNCSSTRIISDMDYGDKTFYAKWAFNRPYTITYILNDGINYVGAPTSYNYGTTVVIDGVPTKDNFLFVGWCDDMELTQNCTPTKTITATDVGDKIYYAKWGLTTCVGGYALEYGECVACGESNWCADGVRHDCPAGLVTIGYGTGADEVGDCGRKLNIGTETIYMRSIKKTTPALNILFNGTQYYGNATTKSVAISADSTHHLHVNFNGTIYSIYDDSMQNAVQN